METLGSKASLRGQHPTVSILIPAYNGEKTVLRTISSIIQQRYRPMQLILIDDGSRDSTTSLVEDFLKRSGFSGEFNLVKHERNLGLSMSLNDGIKNAHGEYVLVLHQDCEFVGNEWVSKALSLMKDKSVAVVTGYYGISDPNCENFVKRAFGVLRKQFHSRPMISCEEATFSEGKCDLYRKDLLLKIGGFPTGFRIAGEDLIVSYRLRSLGYTIIKCYDLHVIQRFTASAESFSGNLSKEFLFGKVMGGVFSEFKLFVFKGLKNSDYSGSRSLHRASQPLFTLAIFISVLLSFFSVWWFVGSLIGLLLTRIIYYIDRLVRELRIRKDSVRHPLAESMVIAFIGITTDFVYSLGFGYGLIKHGMGKKL